MKREGNWERKAARLFGGMIALFGTGIAGAAPSGANQMASGVATPISAHLEPLGLPAVDLTPIGKTEGSAPPSYSESVDQAEVDESEPFVGLVVGPLLTVEAITAQGTASSAVGSDLDVVSSVAATSSQGSANDMDLQVGVVTSPLGSVSTLSITADRVDSSAAISGSFNDYVLGGEANCTNLVVSVLGVPVSNLPQDPPVNTSIDLAASGLAGATLKLNEELIEGDETSGYSVTRNALRVSFDSADLGIAGLGAVTGDVVVGHSFASQLSDVDRDGLLDTVDGDADGDGIPSSVEQSLARNLGDTDGDLVRDEFDLDSDNDGINDVLEAGGVDTDGDGMQDASGDADPDEDGDGIVDSVDTDDPVNGGGNGSELLIPDNDGDDVKNYIDLDSDNDTIPDLYEANPNAADLNDDGVVDGLDLDGDGISAASDGLPNSYGDANDTAPLDSDGDGIPNYIDPDSDNKGGNDIDTVGNGALDTDGDGHADLPITDIDGDGIPDSADGDTGAFGGPSGFVTWPQWQPTITDLGKNGWDDDADGDTASNGHEFYAGTDPNDPSSVPSMTISTTGISGGTFVEVTAERNPSALAFANFEVSGDLDGWALGDDALDLLESASTELAARAKSALGPDSPRAFIRLTVVTP